MALFGLLLFVLLGLSMGTMYSGFMLARRMGFYLMPQVMMLMFSMFASIGVLVVGLFLPPATPALFDLLSILLIVNLVFAFLAMILEFVQVVPILLKTMQGGPFHNSHVTSLLVLFFYLLGLVVYYPALAIM